jgi:phage baseplate assembly protein gpV
VASPQWVTIDTEKDYLTGERKLPPVNSFVFCLMPNGDPNSALVLCSVFAYQDSMGGGIGAFKEEGEDAKEIDKKVDSGGWLFTHDKRTGSRRMQNAPVVGEETIALEVDQESAGDEKIALTVHGNVIECDRDGGIKITTDKNITLEAEGQGSVTIQGDAAINVNGNLTAEAAGNVEVKGTNVTVEAAAMLTLKSGDAAPWMPNTIPACPFGIPHG